MKHFLPLSIATLCLSLFFSCSTAIEPPPSQSQNELSSSAADGGSKNYCVYLETRQCHLTSQTTCIGDGVWSDYCPFPNSSSNSSSNSNQIETSSSSDTEPPYSSSSSIPTAPIIPSSSSVLPSSSDNAPITSFNLVATIYDTDASVHPDFSCGTYRMGMDEGNGPNTRGPCDEGPQAISGVGGNLKPKCGGVVKGLVKTTLNPATRKIEYSGNDPRGCWTNADWFNKAFTSTSGVNVEYCYNMPLALNTVGKFEFDSDRMLNASGRLVGGFFPAFLNNTPSDASCPSCNTKRSADRFPPRITTLTKDMFDNYQSREGDFKDGDTPKLSAFGLTSSMSESIYDWYARDTSSWYLHGSTPIKNSYGSSTSFAANSKANQHFCFESHANFVYDPEQVFYISGDDDVWVYINNRLVIDLGGNHMPAPDHINLNKLGLAEGETYPLDIFFCDRRTNLSNLRISTNILLTQTTTCGN